ncbi:MAG TPA: efflux RND transporter periplasmic adaptor subunit [Phycisphaerales bacterium]|nr:efflux RND transporter periplasmic adaptor subunit [Phycisphaerales bacterium]
MIVGAAVLGAALGCAREPVTEPAAAAREPVTVRVLKPRIVEMRRTVRATGTLHGDEETTIAAKVAGRVVECSADLGDRIEPGELLATIDPTDYELARDEREGAFREVLASIGLGALPEGAFDVDALPTVVRARLEAENARVRYERGRALAEREPPLIAAQDFADLRTAWEVAESELGVARLSAEATLAEARTLAAQVRIAQQRVIDTVHRAPGAATASGPAGARVYEVAERMVSVGDFVQIGTPLFRLVDSDPLKLRVTLPERRLGAVRAGQAVEISVEPGADDARGSVSRVSPVVDVETRSFGVEVLVPNPEHRLKPGSFAATGILVGVEPGLVVPEEAIVTFAGVHKVVLVVGGKADEREVELGERQDGMVEVLRGLAEGDLVVADPSRSLVTGVPVTIAADGGAAVPASDTGGPP